jgi:hypothetical protein
MPKPADLVVCLKTLEHIEPECLDGVLNDLQRCTNHIIWLTVSCFASSITLEDGRNVHQSVHDINWWLPKLMERWQIKQVHSFNTQQWFWFLGVSKNP